MIFHKDISNAELRQKINQKEICYGGNSKLKIYGRLDCGSGKRTKRKNRIFFKIKQKRYSMATGLVGTACQRSMVGGKIR